MGRSPRKKLEISGSVKCISVDPGDGFAMDNGESKKFLRSDRGSPPPPYPWICHWHPSNLIRQNIFAYLSTSVEFYGNLLTSESQCFEI